MSPQSIEWFSMFNFIPFLNYWWLVQKQQNLIPVTINGCFQVGCLFTNRAKIGWRIVSSSKYWCEVREHEILNNINFWLEWTIWIIGTRRVLILKHIKWHTFGHYFTYFASCFALYALQEYYINTKFGTMLYKITEIFQYIYLYRIIRIFFNERLFILLFWSFTVVLSSK